MGLLDRAKSIANQIAHAKAFAPLLAFDEKSEMESLLEKQMLAFYDEHGGRKLLEPDWCITVTAARGTEITKSERAEDELGRVRVGDLLSIRGLLTSESPQVVITRNMLANLATEATKELSRQINELALRASKPQEPPSLSK